MRLDAAGRLKGAPPLNGAPIAWAADKKAPMVHGRIDVTDEEYRSFGGHLLEGSIIDALGFVPIFELAGASLADLE